MAKCSNNITCSREDGSKSPNPSLFGSVVQESISHSLSDEDKGINKQGLGFFTSSRNTFNCSAQLIVWLHSCSRRASPSGPGRVCSPKRHSLSFPVAEQIHSCRVSFASHLTLLLLTARQTRVSNKITANGAAAEVLSTSF